jgi:hypothetical protein
MYACPRILVHSPGATWPQIISDALPALTFGTGPALSKPGLSRIEIRISACSAGPFSSHGTWRMLAYYRQTITVNVKIVCAFVQGNFLRASLLVRSSGFLLDF